MRAGVNKVFPPQLMRTAQAETNGFSTLLSLFTNQIFYFSGKSTLFSWRCVDLALFCGLVFGDTGPFLRWRLRHLGKIPYCDTLKNF
jgi:hypothetical protein